MSNRSLFLLLVAALTWFGAGIIAGQVLYDRLLNAGRPRALARAAEPVAVVEEYLESPPRPLGLPPCVRVVARDELGTVYFSGVVPARELFDPGRVRVILFASGFCPACKDTLLRFLPGDLGPGVDLIVATDDFLADQTALLAAVGRRPATVLLGAFDTAAISRDAFDVELVPLLGIVDRQDRIVSLIKTASVAEVARALHRVRELAPQAGAARQRVATPPVRRYFETAEACLASLARSS